MELHPINQFTDEFIYSLAHHIYTQLAIGIDRMEGKTFEKFLCKIFGVKWNGSNDGLIDVQVNGTGFSIKSLFFPFPVERKKGGNKSVRTIIGRCAPDYHGMHISKETPPKDAAAIVTKIWNERLATANKIVNDFRTLTFLKSNDLLRWCLFEFVPQHYDPDDFVWKWETKKCKGKYTTNLQGVRSDCKLTWQLHGAQFSLSQLVPSNHTEFLLKKPPAIEDILKQIGYENNWVKITRSEKQNTAEVQIEDVECVGDLVLV